MITGKGVITRDQKITAYEIAVANGFVGTEQEWLDSLVPQPSFKVYKARVSVTGTNNPVATVIENTLGSPVVWTRPTAGRYFAQNDTFNYDKLHIKIDSSIYGPDSVNVRFNDMNGTTLDFANHVLNVDLDGGVVFYEVNDFLPGVFFYITIEVYP